MKRASAEMGGERCPFSPSREVVVNPAKAYVHGALQAETRQLYPAYLFNMGKSGYVFSWLSDVAGPAERAAVRRLFTNIMAFHDARKAAEKTCVGKVARWGNHSYYDKRTIQDDALWAETSARAEAMANAQPNFAFQLNAGARSPSVIGLNINASM